MHRFPLNEAFEASDAKDQRASHLPLVSTPNIHIHIHIHIQIQIQANGSLRFRFRFRFWGLFIRSLCRWAAHVASRGGAPSDSLIVLFVLFFALFVAVVFVVVVVMVTVPATSGEMLE